MSLLSIFPTEILECITSILNISQQIRLWQCGDRILNYKLKNGGLKRTSLCWSSSPSIPWPRWYFITFDRLVDVKWFSDWRKRLCPTLEFNLLPATLNRLHLACDDLFVILREQKVNMNALLPMLKDLRLSGAHLHEENLQNLPSNLIELHVSSNHVEKIMSSTVFGGLPRRLQKLTFDFMIVDEKYEQNDLPSDLLSLEILGIQSDFNWFSKLPKSLQSLKITFLRFEPDWLTLPPQLEVIILDRVRLPKEIFPRLPPSLKTLELLDVKGLQSGDELFPLLPIKLTRFSVIYNTSFTRFELQPLPVSLTDFDARISATHPDILSIFRPDAITIWLSNGPFAKQLNPIHPFPTKLQTLKIYYLSNKLCTLLPAGLRTLEFKRGKLTTKGTSKLPKSLTHLRAPFGAFYDNQAMSYLGHISEIHLVGLKAGPHNKLDENWLHSLLPAYACPDCPNQDLSEIPYLNDYDHRLTSLEVWGISADEKNGIITPYVQKSFFEALPRFKNLKELTVMWFRGISSDWLSFIPPNVTSLSLRYLTSEPTATQLSSLPKGLIYQNLSVKSESLPNG